MAKEAFPGIKIIPVVFIFIHLFVFCGSAGGGSIFPFQADVWPIPANGVDLHVLNLLEERGIKPARPCSDEVFIRRVYLDLTGTLPDPSETVEFLKDTRPDKRAFLIEFLISHDGFADYWSLKWCDLLRVKSEFPINLWPNAVQAYHWWLLGAVRSNLPYDKFVREMLTASGSNFRRPQVNFYRAVPGSDPSDIAGAVALTFMGARFDRWPEERRRGMEVFFSRVAFKSTAEWKEEVVFPDPAPAAVLEAVFPDGQTLRILPEQDPRLVFTDWLVCSENPWFASNIVNRIWYWLMGRGIIHEPDDIRHDNPASNPELLEFLESELVNSGYDLRHIYRLILNSRTYQQSSIPADNSPGAGELFAYYPVRRLEAEVLIDAICKITGTGEEYNSLIPEPFTYTPEHQRSILLADGSITSPFLELFGRPARDTGLEFERDNLISEKQQLYLMNSTDIQRRIERSPYLGEIVRSGRRDRGEIVRQIYLLVMSRYPSQDELASAIAYLQTESLTLRESTVDLVWALINSKEFLYRH